MSPVCAAQDMDIPVWEEVVGNWQTRLAEGGQRQKSDGMLANPSLLSASLGLFVVFFQLFGSVHVEIRWG